MMRRLVLVLSTAALLGLVGCEAPPPEPATPAPDTSSVAAPARMTAAIPAIADIPQHLDRTRPQVPAGLHDIDPHHVPTLQAFHRGVAPLVEQPGPLVVADFRATGATAARIVDHQQDASVGAVESVDGALQLAAMPLLRVARIRWPVSAGIVAAVSTRTDAPRQQQDACAH